MELVLYYIKECGGILASFLIFMFIAGSMCFMAMRNFRQDQKNKVMFYGLFLQMTDTDIIKMSTILIKTFLAFSTTFITDETVMWICLMIMTGLTLIYGILTLKRMVYEIVCTAVQVVII